MVLESKLWVLGVLVAVRVLQSMCFYFPVSQMQTGSSQIATRVKAEGGGSGALTVGSQALLLGDFPSFPLQFGD